MELVSENNVFTSLKGKFAKCLVSESQFYNSGGKYQLFKNRDDPKGKYTRGSDGIYDRVGGTVSKFKIIEEAKK